MALQTVRSVAQPGLTLKRKRSDHAPQPTESQPQSDAFQLAGPPAKQPALEPQITRHRLLDAVWHHPAESTRCLAALMLGEAGDIGMVSPLTDVVQDERVPVSVRNSALDACQKLWKSWAIKVREPRLDPATGSVRAESPFLMFDDITRPEDENPFLPRLLPHQ